MHRCIYIYMYLYIYIYIYILESSGRAPRGLDSFLVQGLGHPQPLGPSRTQHKTKSTYFFFPYVEKLLKC